MGKYYNSINDKLKNYFNILEKEFPEWLEEYIDEYLKLKVEGNIYLDFYFKI